MRMIVAGGGTGGHLFPGLAVAECIAKEPEGAVLFVGSRFGIEARVIPQTRFPFRALPIRGLRGRGWLGVLQLTMQLPGALLHSWHVVTQFRPDVVLGVGGYASFPVVVAAWLRRIPIVLLEQNARPGWTNRILGRLAQRICTTFNEAAAYFPADRVVRTGNPVRTFRTERPTGGSGFTLLVFGGSQGARRINDAMYEAAPLLAERIAGLHILHQTGPQDVERLRARYAEIGISAEVFSFIDDMGAAYAAADLVVCRAGATTVAEVTALGKPAIFVPYPFAADDHQRANAEVLAKQSAGVLLLDRELTGPRLADTVVPLAQERARRQAMGEKARALAVPDAAARVVTVCREVVEEMRSHG